LMSDPILLNSLQMAEFVSRGFLRMDSVVPRRINQQFLHDIGHVREEEITSPTQHYVKVMRTSALPVVRAGTALSKTYEQGSALKKLIELPIVDGAIKSLVGAAPNFDHHFLHMTFPPQFSESADVEHVTQHNHQDSTIDPRSAFDIQIMYFPHRVTINMGGTRFIPGTHLRQVSEVAIGRYQNMLGQQHIVCPAGSLLFLHMGMWHGAGVNLSKKVRYMFKIRLCPTQRQLRLWDDSDLPADHFEQRPIFWMGKKPDPKNIHTILTTPEAWFEGDTGRLEYLNRIRLWRYLLGDSSFDADYWLTRVENEYPF
jgi:hypothetical protein